MLGAHKPKADIFSNAVDWPGFFFRVSSKHDIRTLSDNRRNCLSYSNQFEPRHTGGYNGIQRDIGNQEDIYKTLVTSLFVLLWVLRCLHLAPTWASHLTTPKSLHSRL
ncbi:hypothetical protein F0562_035555 [Nyssa sinensis]|uniref:Uncharacterized protein n=1 Tax=Nyssa sinensis TaxID=561372 RepID=A0A5J5AD84_9ASTE|nr:hypothetical protein F0562_035555 [Nyssa sinensis]